VKPANVLKIESLPENWRDKDEILLHASFQLLKNFIEQEKEIIEQINWKHDGETENAKSEIDFLYNWWLKRVDKNDDLDEKQYEEDNLMLRRLIDVRKYLWT
jgi:hypothetical protein